MKLANQLTGAVFTLGSFLLANPAFGVDPLVEVGGGRPARTDCYATLKANVNAPKSNPRSVRCVDGDPTCDGDATVNGVCSFAVTVCANSTFNPTACTSTGIETLTVEHGLDDGVDPAFDPDMQALQAVVDNDIVLPTTTQNLCSSTSQVRVRIKGPTGKPLTNSNRCQSNYKVVRLFTQPQPLVGPSDADKLKLTCIPASAEAHGCEPQQLFSGTYDRIQKQVFSASCAVATCHDSESHDNSGGLLLEPGAALNNTVNQDPQNPAALGLGWRRIQPGNSATSFLMHKIDNDLTDAVGLGSRMPRPPGRRMLPASSREIIRLWIDAGVPDVGWVPGTD